MQKFYFLFVFISFFPLAQEKVQVDTILMGSPFRFIIYGEEKIQANKIIEKGIEEVVRIENMLSEWKKDTPVSYANTKAGKEAIAVEPELFSFIEQALYFNEKSEGLFDITYAGMERIWKYDGSMDKLPDSITIQRALEGVGSKYIQLNKPESTLFLTHPKTKISFGSIGKAYAAQCAANLMHQQFHVKNLMVNASGDIVVYGSPPGKKYWTIGIFRPFQKRKYKKVHITNQAIVTSGDYEKFALIEGKYYGHIINPKTGYPSSKITSVTVKGNDAVIANFLSTTLMLADKKMRKNILKSYPDYKVWIQFSKK